MNEYLTDHSITKDRLASIYNLQLNQLKEFIATTRFDVNTQDKANGDTLLRLAIQNENYNLSSFLLEAKANPNCRNKHGKTPLHYAIEVNNHKLINILLENNADPNMRDKAGDTPMHIAAFKGECKVIRLLLLYKADTAIRNNKLLRPIDCARENCHFKCVNILSETTNNHKEDIDQLAIGDSKHKRVRSCLTFPSNQQTECMSNKEDSAVTSGRSKGQTRETKTRPFDSDTKTDLVFEDNNIAESMISHSQERNLFPWYGTEKGIAINFEDSGQIGGISPFIDIEQFTSFGNYKEDFEGKEEFKDEGDIVCTFKSKNNHIREMEPDVERDLFQRRSTKSSRRDNTLRCSITKEGGKGISSYEEIDFCFSMQSKSKRNTLMRRSKNRVALNDKIAEYNDNEEGERDDDSIIDNTFDNDDGCYSPLLPTEEYCSNDIIDSNLTEEEEESAYKRTKTSNSELTLEHILKSIGMAEYISLLASEGFDDMPLILSQMQKGYGISDKQLKEAGILIPGHRARILIKLQEESKGFDFVFQSKSVYHLNQSKFEDGAKDYQVKMIEAWLKELKMESYLRNFYEGAYHSIDLLFLQMASVNPLDDDLLRNELNIDKLGYRARILNQLKEDSIKYASKLKMRNIEYTNKLNMNQESCRCIIY